jgi:hypothetical protein
VNFSRGRAWAFWLGTPCPYCGDAMALGGRRHPSLEHMIPKSRGGLHVERNLLIVCVECNQDKRDLTLPEWLRRLRRDGDPRAAVVEATMRAIAGAERPMAAFRTAAAREFDRGKRAGTGYVPKITVS